MPGVALGQSPRTLLVYLAAGRTYQWDFYRDIAKTPRNTSDVRFVVLTNDVSAISKELSDNGVHADEIDHVTIAQTKIREVPTLLLVNNAGRLLQVWRGLPNETQQPQVVAITHGK